MKNYLYPLIAVHKDGGTNIVLYTREVVYNFIHEYGRFYDRHTHWVHDWKQCRSNVCYNDWIVRDNAGKIVSYDDFPYRYNYTNPRIKKARGTTERGLPIPGTGCSKAGRKQNHPAKKNSGDGARGRNAVKAAYENKKYNIQDTKATKYNDPWFY